VRFRKKVHKKNKNDPKRSKYYLITRRLTHCRGGGGKTGEGKNQTFYGASRGVPWKRGFANDGAWRVEGKNNKREK